MARLSVYLRGIGDGTSQWWGWLLGYTDTPNQSISGKAFDDYLTDKRQWPRRWVNKIFYKTDDHCKIAWLKDEERAVYETKLKAHRRAHHGDRL